MKYKSYEDSNEEYASGLNTELLGPDDIISARSLNRPIINIEENQEEENYLIQTLLKSVYGNSSGIVPDVLEEFEPETFTIGSFKNDTSNYFLRIPTGLMMINSPYGDSAGNNSGNPFAKIGENDYNDNSHRTNYLHDEAFSYAIENKPNISLYERQLANLINLDLTDSSNDIKVTQKLIPLAYKVALVKYNGGKTSSSTQDYDSLGNAKYVENDDSNVLYLADYDIKSSSVNYYSIKGNGDVLKSSRTIEVDKINSKTSEIAEDACAYYVEEKEDGTYDVTSVASSAWTDKTTLIFTDNIDYAKVRVDSNGNKKRRNGYYLNIVRATSEDDEETYLPNKSENANWKILFPAVTTSDNESETIYVKVTNSSGTEIETISIDLTSGSYTSQTINDKVFNNINSFAEKIYAEKYLATSASSDILYGVKILCNSSETETNGYKLTAYYKDGTFIQNNDTDSVSKHPGDQTDTKQISNVSANSISFQKYFTNVFEMTNSFLGYYSSYLININNIYNYLNLETILKVKSDMTNKNIYIYYDINSDTLNNKNSNSYDKTGRFVISTSELTESNYIHLYDIRIISSDAVPYNYKVSSVKAYFNPLDRRMISTKRAELNSLLSDTRTELTNYVDIKDSDANRRIEITEDSNTADKEQMRLSSPITRIVDTPNLVLDANKVKHYNDITLSVDDNEDGGWTDAWTDSGNGDTPSDFFESSHAVRNFDTNVTSYTHHTDSYNKGIIIDKNKGIKIFNTDENLTNGIHSYSSFKPIEIISSTGNINLFNTSNTSGRINISNLQDSSSNIIDLKGLTRIRSANDSQLAIRKIGAYDTLENIAGISFVVGTSTSKDDTDYINNNTKNLLAGALKFYSGTSGASTDVNKKVSNRFFELDLAATGAKTQNKVLVSRNSNRSSKMVTTFYGDIVPDTDPALKSGTNSIGYALNSITCGTSTDYINKEGRWSTSFIDKGYFGKVTLADRLTDIINDDIRNGALDCGNSNIYNASSIYINNSSSNRTSIKNISTINFDTNYKNAPIDNKVDTNIYENTIYSQYNSYDSPSEYDGVSIILNRYNGLTQKRSVDNESIIGFCPAYFKPYGTEFGKNVYVKRQLIVNNSTNATDSDNSSLVVKGQSVMNGELVIGKDTTIVKSIDTTSSGAVTRSISNDYKLYNNEFKTSSDNEAANLYIFRTYGRNYFDGDITLKDTSKFTESSTFNKKLIVLNKNYASYDFNTTTKTLSDTTDSRYISSVVFDKYYVDEPSTISTKSQGVLPRHNTSVDVASGKVVFGSSSLSGDTDNSDMLLYGTQWIKRRLNIDLTGDQLINTYMQTGSLINRTSVSPSLYINGASQLSGDIVFGGNLLSETVEEGTSVADTTKISKKLYNSYDSSNYRAIKAIFWGSNNSATSSDYKTSFDFHGKTLFDGDIYIGSNITDYADQIYDEPIAYIYGGFNAYSEDKNFVVKSKNVSLSGYYTNGGTYQAILNLKGGDTSGLGTADLTSSGSTILKAQSSSSGYINTLTMNSSGTTLETTDANITASSNAIIKNDPGNYIELDKSNIKAVSSGSISASATKDISLESTGKTDISSKSTLDISSTSDMSINSSTKITESSTNSISLDSSEIDLSSSNIINIKSTVSNISSCLNLKGGAMNTTSSIGTEKYSTSLTEGVKDSKITITDGKINITDGIEEISITGGTTSLAGDLSVTGSTKLSSLGITGGATFDKTVEIKGKLYVSAITNNPSANNSIVIDTDGSVFMPLSTTINSLTGTTVGYTTGNITTVNATDVKTTNLKIGDYTLSIGV